MKEIIAVIRPGCWFATRDRIERLGVTEWTEHRVLGRGRDRGLRYLAGQGGPTGVAFLPKRLVSCLAPDAQAPALVAAILAINRTGRLGDGRIFVLPVEEAKNAAG